MRLTPREQDRLPIFLAAQLARSRRERGLRLNVPEAAALVATPSARRPATAPRLAEASSRRRRCSGPTTCCPASPTCVTEVRSRPCSTTAPGSRGRTTRSAAAASATPRPARCCRRPSRPGARAARRPRSTVTQHRGGARSPSPATSTSSRPTRGCASTGPAAYGRRLHVPAGSSGAVRPGRAPRGRAGRHRRRPGGDRLRRAGRRAARRARRARGGARAGRARLRLHDEGPECVDRETRDAYAPVYGADRRRPRPARRHRAA